MNKKIEDLLCDQGFRRFVLNPHQGESADWGNWAKLSEENQKLYQEARNLIIDFYNPLSPEEFESQSIEFTRRINVTKSDQKDIISLYEQRRPKNNSWIKYAAAILFLISATFVIISLTQNYTFTLDELAENLITKETSRGQKMTIVFPDGTVVKLNSESSITYSEEFSKEKREVKLIGEAYFDVAHYDDWPFIVNANEVKTEVLGTTFNISAYPENEHVSIALVNGSVKVNALNIKPVELHPGEMAVVGIRDKDVSIEDFDFEKVTGWKDNIIIFDKVSFSEMEFALERWFDVEFIYDAEPILEGGYTGDFSDMSLPAILEGLSTDKFDFEIDGKKVYIN